MNESSCSSDTSDDDIPTDLNSGYSSSDESIIAPPYSPVAYDTDDDGDGVVDDDDVMDDESGRFTE